MSVDDVLAVEIENYFVKIFALHFLAFNEVDDDEIPAEWLETFVYSSRLDSLVFLTLFPRMLMASASVCNSVSFTYGF